MQTRRYGLGVKFPNEMHHVEGQLESFKSWRTVAINLNRENPVKPIDVATWDMGDKPIILGYLGFCQAFMIGPQVGWHPSLKHYCNWPWFLKFIAFLVARGASIAWLKSHVTTAIYALEWLKGQTVVGGEQAKLATLQSALKRLHTQVKWVGARPKPKDPSLLDMLGQWADYKDLAKIVYGKLRQASW